MHGEEPGFDFARHAWSIKQADYSSRADGSEQLTHCLVRVQSMLLMTISDCVQIQLKDGVHGQHDICAGLKHCILSLESKDCKQAGMMSTLQSDIPHRKNIAKTDVIIKACVSHWVLVNKHKMNITTLSNATQELGRLRQLTALQALGKVLLLNASS